MTLLPAERKFQPDGFADFRVRTTFWIAIAGVVFLAPFGINNAIQGRALLGLGATGVVMVLVMLAWVSHKGRSTYLSLLLFPPVIGFLALSIQEQGVIGVMWAYPGVVSFYFIMEERWAWIANTCTIVVVVPTSAAVLEPALAVRAMMTLLVVSCFSIMAVRVIGQQQTRLEQMATTDSLTGVYNRSLMTMSLEHSVARFRRSEERATLLAVDIDHFKNINDTYGHQTGDNVLVGIAELLRGRLRETDAIFRTGGEEFMIVLPDTDLEPALYVAQLLRSAIAGENLIDSHPVTVSVGVAKLRGEDCIQTWMARADQCLYRAKAAGRNRVETDEALVPPVAVV